MVVIMQQSGKKNKTFVNLELLIDTINNSYNNGENSELESHIYNTFSHEEMKTLLGILNKQYKDKNILDILNDDNIRDIIISRIKYNLSLRIYMKVPNDSNSDTFFIKFFIEQYLLMIFNDLLTAHILSSKKMCDRYLSELNRIRKNINFKYASDTEHRINYCMRYFLHHIDDTLFNDTMEFFFIDLIEDIIDFISSLTDQDLEQDEIYAKAIAYQILLRSILLMEQDLDVIDYYRDKYLKLQDDSIASSIIKTAFIANFNDKDLAIKSKIY